jgi:hypothetical protein
VWSAELGHSPWVTRLACAVGYLTEVGDPAPTYMVAGMPLTRILAFEGVRLGRGFDRVWQSVCGGDMRNLQGWGKAGENMAEIGALAFNALYGFSGANPLGFFVTSPGVMGLGDLAVRRNLVIAARQRWESYGWSTVVPNEWEGLAQCGSSAFAMDAGGSWSSFTEGSVAWAMVLAAEANSAVEAVSDFRGVARAIVTWRLGANVAVAGSSFESFSPPTGWMKAWFMGFRFSGFMNVPNGMFARQGVLGSWGPALPTPSGDTSLEGGYF